MGGAVATLLALVVASVTTGVVGSPAACHRLARGVVLVPVVAVLPFSVLLLLAATRAPVLAVLPLAVTAVPAATVWWSPRAGIVVSGLLLVAGVATVVALGLDAVILLLPHLTLSFGCWAVAVGLLTVVARPHGS